MDNLIDRTLSSRVKPITYAATSISCLFANMGGSALNNDALDWSILGQQIGLGVLLGLAVGYLAKKALKVLLVLTGVLLIILITLQNFDLIQINWANIEALYNSTVQHQGGIIGILRDWAEEMQKNLPVAGSFLIGFLVGLKLG